MQPKARKDLATFSAKKVKNAAAEERERRVFLCRRTVRVTTDSTVILTNFLKIEKMLIRMEY